jgi:hypothetical protein
MYLIDLGGDPDDRARREEERAQRRADVSARYAAHLVQSAGVDEVTAHLVLAALFDHRNDDGSPCPCGCHPRLPEGELHDAGFDCRCGWDEDRRRTEKEKWRASLEAFWASAEGEELKSARAAEMAELDAWLAAHPGVSAQQTTPAAPEQWEGTVDGRTFYFRERHGDWRLELDLEPTGHFANRVIAVGPDGATRTEPVEMTAGTVIAEGPASRLGERTVEHLEFIVRTIREHITGETCPHLGAINFCPACGARV